jgi:hypothetical protein
LLPRDDNSLETARLLSGPALQLLALGCCASLMATGRLTLRLILPVMLYGTTVPLLGAAALAAVRGRTPWRRMLHLFFRGMGPWTWWLLATAAFWSLTPPQEAFRLTGAWRMSLIVPLVWSCSIDYRIFREELGYGRGSAAGRLAVQRLLWWTPVVALFVAPAGWQTVANALGI